MSDVIVRPVEGLVSRGDGPFNARLDSINDCRAAEGYTRGVWAAWCVGVSRVGAA